MKYRFITFSELSSLQIDLYRNIVLNAFPDIVNKSPVIARYWARVEQYFPSYQLFVIDEKEDIVGFINSIPFRWGNSLNLLPREGWDWMLIKGITDHEQDISPNSLGGLQIIVSPDHLGQGNSKIIIDIAKRVVSESGFQNFVIPIRPTYKSRHPHMSMIDYIDYKVDNKIYDPWIRTHLRGGAEIISICDRAMHVYGDLTFWETIMKRPILETADYIVEGALNPVHIDVDKNYGEYFEDNIWISYELGE